MMRACRAGLEYRVDTAITFDPTVGSLSNFYWSFRIPLSTEWMKEFIIGEVEVWSRQARVTVRKGHNLCSDRWIAIKLLIEFPDALFHGMVAESIICHL